MSHLAQIPLESYLLAQQAAPIACLVCDHENCCSAARCRNCSAPMALAHQTQSIKKRPHMIAVIGATETPGSVGRTIVWNLISSSFGGTIYPVNPKRASILGISRHSIRGRGEEENGGVPD